MNTIHSTIIETKLKAEIAKDLIEIMLWDNRPIADVETACIKSLDDLEKALYWIKFIQRNRPEELKFKRELQKAFRKQAADVARNIREFPLSSFGDNPNPQSVLTAWSFDRGKWVEIFATLSEAPVTRAVDKAGNQTAQDITSEMAKTFSGIIQKFAFDEGDETIKTYLQGKRFRIGALTNQTTEAMLDRALVSSIAAEASIADTTAKVLQVFEFSQRFRAERIARTEIIGAANFGAHQSNLQSGVVVQEEWITAIDERTRETHLAADGQVKEVIDTFFVGGESLRYPGDENGSPENIINCFTGDMCIILSDCIEKIYRHSYEGDLYEITTESHVFISGTPNHPLLTLGGWRAMKEFIKGDVIISGRAIRERKRITLNELFCGCKEYEDSEYMTGNDSDFHGDGSGDKTEVIYIGDASSDFINANIDNTYGTTSSNYAYQDKIVDIRISKYVGDVYNLQTKTGWYIASHGSDKGILSRNCRCTTKPIVDRQLQLPESTG